MLTIAILLIIAIIIVKLVLNYKLWLYHKTVNHSKEWKIMAVCCVPSIVMFAYKSSIITWGGDPLWLLILFWALALLLSGLMCAFFIWLFFDGIYNVLRGFNWWFTGSDDADDAKSDNFLQSLKLWQHVAIKICGLALLITTYILFYD